MFIGPFWKLKKCNARLKTKKLKQKKDEKLSEKVEKHAKVNSRNIYCTIIKMRRKKQK